MRHGVAINIMTKTNIFSCPIQLKKKKIKEIIHLDNQVNHNNPYRQVKKDTVDIVIVAACPGDESP